MIKFGALFVFVYDRWNGFYSGKPSPQWIEFVDHTATLPCRVVS
jgi:hypothetical protein